MRGRNVLTKFFILLKSKNEFLFFDILVNVNFPIKYKCSTTPN